MDKCEVNINGRMYVPKEPLDNKNVKIVILQRGHVKVGYFSQEGDYCKLENCATIRIWGTERGLGQIAFDGPTKNTILDKEPTCHFHILTTICLVDCVGSKWEKYLS